MRPELHPNPGKHRANLKVKSHQEQKNALQQNQPTQMNKRLSDVGTVTFYVLALSLDHICFCIYTIDANKDGEP